MSGTWPTSPGPKSIELHSEQPILESTSGSGKSQRRITAGHLWRLRLNYPPMIRAEVAPIFGFEMKQRGDSFQVSLPDKNAPQGAVTGSISVNGSPAADVSTVFMDGFVPGTADVFKAGDIFNPDSTSKVHMVTDDVSAGATVNLLDEDSSALIDEDSSALIDESSGQAEVNFAPPLIAAIPDNTNITYNNVQFTVFIDGNGIQKWKTTAPQLSAYSVELKEAL